MEKKRKSPWLFPEVVGFLRQFFLSKNDSATLKLMPRWALHDRTHACSHFTTTCSQGVLLVSLTPCIETFRFWYLSPSHLQTKRSDFGGQRSFAFATFRLVLFQIGTRLFHRVRVRQLCHHRDSQPTSAKHVIGPGWAHGGGWAHLCLRRVCLPVCLPGVGACVMTAPSVCVVVSPGGASVLEAPRRVERQLESVASH